MSSARGPVGIFGGTFDPVHYGHLRSALELVEHLQLDHLRLMPCGTPPHGKTPALSAVHRAAMVELAVADEPRLRCDRRELNRTGASWTIDSLEDLRRELGREISLCLVMGGDAVARITTWHRWQDLLGLAHIVVLARPGWALPGTGDVAHWLEGHRLASAAALHDRPCGGVYGDALRQLPISSTEIRNLLAQGQSARYLLPEQVLDYIQSKGLYQ